MTITEAADIKYFARPGAPFNDTRAETLGPWIAGIVETCGNERKAAEVFVEEAADKKHHAHDLLEWDNTKCGREHRLRQAQGVIRHLGIVQLDGAEPNVPAFATIRIETVQAGQSGEDPNPTYQTIPMAEALSEEGLRMKVLRQAMTIVNGQRDTLDQFEEAEALVKQIDKLWRKVCVT